MKRKRFVLHVLVEKRVNIQVALTIQWSLKLDIGLLLAQRAGDQFARR